MNRRFLHSLTSSALVLTALIGLGGVAQANVPMTMAHQGRLFDASGFPVEGSVSVDYSLFTTASGGTPVWAESENPEVKDGFFASVLGDGTTLTPDLFAGGTVYLSVTIDGEELLPRTQLVSVPYAMLADDAVGEIHPRSVSIGTKEVIDENGKWIGDPTGLQGPAGAIGPAGAAGLPGTSGATGPQGATGRDGAIGPRGLQGDIGVTGLACWDLDGNRQCDLASEDHDSSGTCDVLDCTGAVGPQGIAGPVGPRGLQGVAGANGTTGVAGAVGPPGPKGEMGAPGPVGPAGPGGQQGFAGPVGPTGLVGPQGLVGATGAIGPAGSAGATGTIGPTGPQGLVGATGGIGPTGLVGATGGLGAQGLAGPTGATGPAGPVGAAGSVGAIGPQGLMGQTGATGAPGTTGAMGPAGPSGGGTMLTDASGATLGKVLSIGQPVGGSGFTPAHNAYVTIKTSTGHIVSIGMDGLVTFGQIYWTGGTCGAGNAILNSGIATASRKHFCKLVMRSTTGKLYTTGSAACDANGLVDSVLLPGITNIESTGNCSGSTSNQYGWALTEVTNTSIGLPATLALPLNF